MTDIERLAAITDDELRKQAKFDHMTALLQGETGNFGAGILISLCASLAVSMVSHGFDPMHVLLNIAKASRDEARRLLSEQGISARQGPAGPKRLDG